MKIDEGNVAPTYENKYSESLLQIAEYESKLKESNVLISDLKEKLSQVCI